MKKEVESIETAGSLMHQAGMLKNLPDPTEPIRRKLVETINTGNEDRDAIAKEFGQTWDTTELQVDFEVNGFAAPYCIVRRKSDGKMGSIMFKHSPRVYFNFVAD